MGHQNFPPTIVSGLLAAVLREYIIPVEYILIDYGLIEYVLVDFNNDCGFDAIIYTN